MRELFDTIRTDPWPFGAGLFVVILLILAENFGRGIHGDGATSGDFDVGECDGGDGGGD